jgi:hypothetical protein
MAPKKDFSPVLMKQPTHKHKYLNMMAGDPKIKTKEIQATVKTRPFYVA